ncbi:MAG: hypothetical protein QOH48_1459 [Actinomycetota bacterium]|jgi:hypothetical protein|nr:hypothetical protein [Actinomycetota bacterium]
MTTGSSPLDVLSRFREPRKRPRPGEVCDMCAEPIPDEHPHVVNIESRNLMCTCRGCYLLFTHEGAAQGKYRMVPERYLIDPSFELTEADWQAMEIPVKIAFFFFNSSLGRIAAFYPSPGGATESLLPPDAWAEFMEGNHLFGALAPDVEAVLARGVEERFECLLVPIDAAYELVGLVRLHWKGFDGGEEAHAQIDAFFDRLRTRSKQLGPKELT